MSEYPHISFSKVSFDFGDKPLISNLSFEAKPGQHTILKGDSGSGKSTIMKLLLGFFMPDAGTISMRVEEWTPQTIRKKSAWLPQDLNLGAGSTREVLEKPFEFAVNQSRGTTESKQIGTLQKLGLSADVLDKQFRDLSTGQRQRVGLTLCHLLDKPLLLLDEPTSALDSTSKERAANLMLAHTNRTIISTSHDPYWVKKADKVIELD